MSEPSRPAAKIMWTATPIMPVYDLARALSFYEDRLGFRRRSTRADFPVVCRDTADIGLLLANDPGDPQAQPHLPGTAGCRLQVAEVRALMEEYREKGLIDPDDVLILEPWGSEEFTVLDVDCNALVFYERVS